MFETVVRIPATYVLTSSIVVRGIATAINWFLPPAKRANVYGLDELEVAFAAADLPPATRAEIRRKIEAGRQLLTTASERSAP